MSRKILARVQSGTAVDEALTMMQSLAWVLDMHFLISTYTKYTRAHSSLLARNLIPLMMSYLDSAGCQVLKKTLPHRYTGIISKKNQQKTIEFIQTAVKSNNIECDLSVNTLDARLVISLSH